MMKQLWRFIAAKDSASIILVDRGIELCPAGGSGGRSGRLGNVFSLRRSSRLARKCFQHNFHRPYWVSLKLCVSATCYFVHDRELSIMFGAVLSFSSSFSHPWVWFLLHLQSTILTFFSHCCILPFHRLFSPSFLLLRFFFTAVRRCRCTSTFLTIDTPCSLTARQRRNVLTR